MPVRDRLMWLSTLLALVGLGTAVWAQQAGSPPAPDGAGLHKCGGGDAKDAAPESGGGGERSRNPGWVCPNGCTWDTCGHSGCGEKWSCSEPLDVPTPPPTSRGGGADAARDRAKSASSNRTKELVRDLTKRPGERGQGRPEEQSPPTPAAAQTEPADASFGQRLGQAAARAANALAASVSGEAQAFNTQAIPGFAEGTEALGEQVDSVLGTDTRDEIDAINRSAPFLDKGHEVLVESSIRQAGMGADWKEQEALIEKWQKLVTDADVPGMGDAEDPIDEAFVRVNAWLNSDDPELQNAHALRNGDQTDVEGLAGIRDRMEDDLYKALLLRGAGKDEYAEQYGGAFLHNLEDSYSGAHMERAGPGATDSPTTPFVYPDTHDNRLDNVREPGSRVSDRSFTPQAEAAIRAGSEFFRLYDGWTSASPDEARAAAQSFLDKYFQPSSR